MKVDRPLECSGCKKPIKVHYSEIVDDKVTRIGMCADCPALARKLGEVVSKDNVQETKVSGSGADLSCTSCGTSAEDIQMGYRFGCAECYEVFGEMVVAQLVSAGGFCAPPTEMQPEKYHVGRAPGEVGEISPSMRLIVLNEALKETLSAEDYEQAAWIRDQISKIEGGEGDV